VALKIVDELKKLPGQVLQLISDLGSDLRAACGKSALVGNLRKLERILR